MAGEGLNERMMAKFKNQLLSLWNSLMARPAFVRALGRMAGRAKQMHGGPFDPTQVRRILVMRMDALGDTILTLPLLQSLREHWPEAHITYVASPLATQVLEHDSRINSLLPINTGGSLSLTLRAYEWWRTARDAGNEKGFDLAVLPRWDRDEYGCAIQSHLLGARWIVGHRLGTRSPPWTCATSCDYLLTIAVDGATGHEVERGFHLLKALGIKPAASVAPIGTTQGIETEVDQWLEQQGVNGGQSLVALGVGAGDPSRVWPKQHFAELAQRLDSEWTKIVVIGGPSDQETAAYLAGYRCLDGTRLPGVAHSAALLKRASLFVGNDSGPMHLAAAQGVPVVEISAHPQGADDDHAQSPARFGPWRVPQAVLRPAAGRTIQDVSPAEVLMSVAKLTS